MNYHLAVTVSFSTQMGLLFHSLKASNRQWDKRRKFSKIRVSTLHQLQYNSKNFNYFT